MQVLGSSEMPSRLSVENQSDDLSCANSAMSIDYPEQASSTIGELCLGIKLFKKKMLIFNLINFQISKLMFIEKIALNRVIVLEYIQIQQIKIQ